MGSWCSEKKKIDPFQAPVKDIKYLTFLLNVTNIE